MDASKWAGVKDVITLCLSSFCAIGSGINLFLFLKYDYLLLGPAPSVALMFLFFSCMGLTVAFLLWKSKACSVLHHRSLSAALMALASLFSLATAIVLFT